MEKEIILNDRLSLSDSGTMRGHVVMTRAEDGKVIFRKDNMIVQNGRKYISDLVLKAINGELTGSSTKIATLRFGTGTVATATENNALGAEVSAYATTASSLDWRIQSSTVYTGYLGVSVADVLPEIVNNDEFVLRLSNNTVYKGIGGVWTIIVCVCEYFFSTNDGAETLYKKNNNVWEVFTPTSSPSYFSGKLNETLNNDLYKYESNVWGELETTGSSGSTFPTSITSGFTFFNKESEKLYIYTNAMLVTALADPQIGILFDVTRTGGDPGQTISELGLFLNDSNKMFSRLVFDGVPFSSAFTYNIKYFIYF